MWKDTPPNAALASLTTGEVELVLNRNDSDVVFAGMYFDQNASY